MNAAEEVSGEVREGMSGLEGGERRMQGRADPLGGEIDRGTPTGVRPGALDVMDGSVWVGGGCSGLGGAARGPEFGGAKTPWCKLQVRG